MAKVLLPDNFDRGAFGIERIGTFHLIVIAVDEYPKKKNGEAINGWQITCGVLAGTEASEKDKQIELNLTHPRGDMKDGGDFCQRVQGRFLLATCLVTEDQSGKDIDIDLEKIAVGRQFIAKFAVQKKREPTDAERIDLDGANIWHVDDSFVAEVPKSEVNLKQLPQSMRMIGGKGPGEPPAAGNTAKKPPKPSQPQTDYAEPMKSGSGQVDYDSL